MDLFKASIKVVFPLFLMMAAGWLIRKTKLFTAEGLAEINRVNVRFFLPLMLFTNVCDGDLFHDTDRNFLIYATACAIVLFILCILIVPVIIKDRKTCPSFILGVYRPNTAIYGLPLASSILLKSDQVANVLMMVSATIFTTNYFAIMVTEIFKGEKPKILTTFTRSFNNPIIYGLVLGLVAQFLPFNIPGILLSPIKSMAAIATPLAFICLGASFSLKIGKMNLKLISIATVLKLIVTPLLVIPLSITLFGFRDETLVAMICAYATPTAVSVLPLIKDIKADDALMGEIIVSTTAFSLFTIFGFVYAFKYFGLL